jgi:pilus assembly protein CpaC
MVLSPNRINYLLKPSVIWAACLSVIATGALWAQAPTGSEIPLVVGKSVVLDVPDEIQRVSITDDTIADVVAISTREILINAKGEGVTTLVLWTRTGDRNFFTVNVGSNLQQIQDLLRAAFPGEPVRLVSSQGLVTLNGSVSSPQVEERLLAMLGGMGASSIVSNLELPIPPADRQIVLRVRFIEVQRNALSEFGANLLSTGAFNTPAGITTQQFGAASIQGMSGTIGGQLSGTATSFNLTDTLNIFAFRPDLNLGVLLKALESRGISQLLAEPNVVTTSGKEADLLIGGEFPVPIIQGGATAGAVTIQFREFGIRINFLPEFTARGSIKMHVRPEVSALDFANAVTLQGFLIPALSTRRVETDVQLMPGQSFVIGGLIDSRMAESENRVPVLSKIPASPHR